MSSNAERVYSRPASTLVPFFALHGFAFLSLATVLATFAFSKQAKRDATSFNLVLVFMTFSVSLSLSLLSGQLTAPASKEENFGLCLVNAGLVIGGSAAESWAAFAVILRILLKILAAKGFLLRLASSKRFVVFLVATPWILSTVFLIASLIVGLRDRDKVYRATLYCAIDDLNLTLSTSLTSGIINIFSLILLPVIAYILIKHYMYLGQVRRESSDGLHQELSQPQQSWSVLGVSVPLLARLSLFLLCILAALICSVTTLNDFTAVTADYAVACVSVIVFSIAALQEDVLRVWGILPSLLPPTTSPALAFHSSSSLGTPIPSSRRLRLARRFESDLSWGRDTAVTAVTSLDDEDVERGADYPKDDVLEMEDEEEEREMSSVVRVNSTPSPENSDVLFVPGPPP